MKPSSEVAILTLMVVLALGALAQAQTFTTLYSFTGGTDGGQPYAGVIRDKAGNLYGTTYVGGDLNDYCVYRSYGCGVVYKLDTDGAETVVYSFTDGSDGATPQTPVIRDSKGNIYGTTSGGGPGGCCGTVFKIDTAGKETTLLGFGIMGDSTDQGVVMDQSENLYGTTHGEDYPTWGTIFEIDTAGHVVNGYNFAGPPSDGASPAGGHVLLDKAGNLYGVTSQGGSGGCYAYGCGVLYKLTPTGTETVLYSFAGGTSDGCTPYGSVVMDKAGNLYGTTYGCGSSGQGTVWRVSKKGKEKILHSFAGGTTDGCNPVAGVVRDSKGNLYGNTSGCGDAFGGGTLWKLTAKGKLTLLHSFSGSDGSTPSGELLRTANGKLFGTTVWGGDLSDCNGGGCGTVWSYLP